MPVPGPHPPYGTPPRPATTPSGQLLAPLGDRLLARLVDLVVLLGLNVVVNGWFFWQYLREVWPAATAAAATGSFVTQVSERAENLQLAMGLISVALWLAYEVPDTASSGQTLGKRLLGIRVVPLDKRPLGFFRSLRRWSIPGVSMLFPILGVPLLLLDSLWCTWDKPYKQCLHDRSARTAVVRAEPARRTP